MSISGISGGIEGNGLLEQEIKDLRPDDVCTKLTNWSLDKGKYFCETLANALFYLKHIPAVRGPFTQAEAGLRDCKTFMGLPVAIKGAMGLYDNLQKGGMKVRNLAGDIAYIVADGIDGIKGLRTFNICRLSWLSAPSNYLAGCSNVCLKQLGKIGLTHVKDVAGLVGLTNSIYNLNEEIVKLKQIDVTKAAVPGSNTNKAVEIKKQWVEAEINTRWHDRLRDVIGVAMCTLGIASATTGVFLSPWVFAALTTVSIVGKTGMYFHKQDATFWQYRYAEVLPAAK